MSSSYRRTALKLIGRGLGVTLPIFAIEAYRYRPRNSEEVDFHERMRENGWEPCNAIERFIYGMGRVVVISFTTHVFGTLMAGSRVDLVDRHKLDRFVTDGRPGGVPLITVANHSSTMDDPGLMSVVAPYVSRWQPSKMRWAICTEEICFANPGAGSFFGMGKALAVKRGGSIYQKGIATLQQKVDAGDWVHVFPEGRCWQEGGAPLRDKDGRWCSGSGRCGPPWQKVGPFKWGVGKLIANSAIVPLVVPFYHAGMNDIMPQGRDNSIISGPHFIENKLVTVMFGEPVPVADLIQSYHEQAIARASERNTRRHAQLAALEEGAVDGIGHEGGGRWWNWLFGRAAGKKAVGAVDAGEPRAVDPALRPVNTVEDYADHSGASAHIAGQTVRLTERQAAEMIAKEAAGIHGVKGGTLHEVLEEALSATRRIRHEAVEKGEAVRAQAEEYAARLSATHMGETLRHLAEEGEAAARELRAEVHAAVGKVEEAVEEAVGPGLAEKLRQTWGGSVSVPGPLPIRVTPEERLSVPLPRDSNGSSSEVGTGRYGRTMSSDPVLMALEGRGAVGVPHFSPSEEMVELVPTRTLSTGVVVPAYVEPPLRIRPPDHDFLTPEEAKMEEMHRLQLYSDIAARLQSAVSALEKGVMERRLRQGHVEARPMQ